jgi:hypothetical protein
MPRHFYLFLLIALAAGVALGFAAAHSVPAGSLWRISFDQDHPQNARNEAPPVMEAAAEDAYCLYRSRRYRLGDSIFYDELKQRAVCAANARGGVWLDVKSEVHCVAEGRRHEPGSIAVGAANGDHKVCALDGAEARWLGFAGR